MPFNFGPVDSLDAVPAEFRPFYAAAAVDGKFNVQDAFKPAVATITGLNNSLAQERGKITNLNSENAQRRQAVAAYESLVSELGITPEDPNDVPGAIRAHVTSLADKVKGGEAFKGDLAKIKAAADKRIADAIAAKDTELRAMQSALEEHMIDKEATAALIAAKAKNGGRVLLPHVKQQLKVVKNEQGKYGVVAVAADGTTIYNNAGAPASVNDIVSGFKSNTEYAFAFESEAASGTGHNPGSGRQAPPPPNKGGELNSTQKISAGLAALAGGRAA